MNLKYPIPYSFFRMFLNSAACLMLLVAACGGARAATLIVSNTADSGPGTLREALASANNGDTIDATGISGTVLLTTGQLWVMNSVSILGPGPGLAQISGNSASRVFYVGSNITVTIAGLTIAQGRSNYGGGIYNDNATLTVSNCLLYGNGQVAQAGGGIQNLGTLTVSASALSNNAAHMYGGGIQNLGTLTVSASSFSGNWCESGAGIYNAGTLTISASTLNNNSGVGGAGIFNGPGTSLSVISNCTLSGNWAEWPGGGIYNYGGTLMVFGSTLSGNYAGTGGGGIFNAGQMQIGNTILNAGASGENITNDEGGTVVSLGYNLSSDAAGGDDYSGPGGLLNGPGDIRNTDPMLGPLGDLGGPTLTHPLFPGSPAIDHGKSFGLTTDQRGLLRAVDDSLVANATGGDGSDIGACEVQSHQACPFMLTGIKQLGGGNDLRLSYTTLLGSNYVIQTKSNPTNGDWTTLPGTSVGIGVVMQSILTNAISAPQGFYRVQQLP